MRRLALILVILIAIIAPAGVAVASDTTDSDYYGTIRVSNNSTAATNVATTVTGINTTNLINGGYINATATNCAIQRSGSDIAFMPGVGSNPWILYEPAIGTNTYLNDIFYTQASNGTIAYFPGSGGMTVTDAASLEISDNGSIGITAFINTANGSNKNIFDKSNSITAFVSPTVSENITVEICGLQDYLDYTEVDTAGRITVSADNITAVDLDRDETAYVYFDLGSGFIDGFTMEFEVYMSSETHNGGSTGGTAFANSIGDYDDWGTTELTFRAYAGDAGEARYGLFRGKDTASDVYTGSMDTPYYVTVTRLSGSDNATALIYTDSARTTLVDTLLVDGYSTTTYRYAYGFLGRNDGLTNRNWDGYFKDLDIFITSITATGISSDEYDLLVTASSGNLSLYIDGSLQDTTSLSTGIPQSTTDWNIGDNSTTLYITSANITVDGTTTGSWQWEYGTTFTDLSGNGNDATPTFRTTRSNANVSATLVDFQPISEADAPAYTITSPTDWVSGNTTVTENFTTTITPTYPGSTIISDAATAGSTPVQLPTLIIASVFMLGLSFTSTHYLKKYNTLSLAVQLFIITIGLGILVAVHVIDNWMLWLFLMIGTAIAMMSTRIGFAGTGTTGNNLVGFLFMSFFGMTLINRILEGRFLQSADINIINDVLVFQPFSVFGWFTIPVPNVSFLTNGIPAIVRWDYSFFGGDAQLIQYMLYSITAVLSFILFVLALGAAYQMFSRGR